jgi:uncharacterized protein YceK
MRSRIVLSGLLAGLGWAAAGCMTLDTRANAAYDGPRTYSGTQRDAQAIGPALLAFSPFFVFHLVDLPFSLVADTLLLPITLPEERERRARIAAAVSTETEQPAPVAPLPQESAEETARRLFETCRERLEQMRGSLADCFSIDARVQTQGELVSGAAYKARLRDALARLRRSGDFITWRDPRFSDAGKRVRIVATLARAQSAEVQAIELLVGPGADEGWRVLEARGVDWAEAGTR